MCWSGDTPSYFACSFAAPTPPLPCFIVFVLNSDANYSFLADFANVHLYSVPLIMSLQSATGFVGQRTGSCTPRDVYFFQGHMLTSTRQLARPGTLSQSSQTNPILCLHPRPRRDLLFLLPQRNVTQRVLRKILLSSLSHRPVPQHTKSITCGPQDPSIGKSICSLIRAQPCSRCKRHRLNLPQASQTSKTLLGLALQLPPTILI